MAVCPYLQAHAPVILAPRQRKQVDYKGQASHLQLLS